MSGVLYDLLLIQSFNLDKLIEDYRVFFLSLLPGIFIMACLIEYFDRINTFGLIKRALISIMILTSVTTFYKSSISMSIQAAEKKLEQQKQSNILLTDLLDMDNQIDKLEEENKTDFFKDKNFLTGSIAFLKAHMFTGFINDGFTMTVYFISQLCIQIIKIVYSLVYYLGYGLVGIPCLIYLFPTMGNILRGSILSYVWCLIIPHILVFVLSMIGSEISQGYTTGQVIGGSISGTVLLFILTLLIAFTPLIGMMIINGSGMAQAGGIIATLGANYVMNLPKQTLNNTALMATGGKSGPKMTLVRKSMWKGGSALQQGMKKVSDLSNKSKSNSQWNPSNNTASSKGEKNFYSGNKAKVTKSNNFEKHSGLNTRNSNKTNSKPAQNRMQNNSSNKVEKQSSLSRDSSPGKSPTNNVNRNKTLKQNRNKKKSNITRGNYGKTSRK